MTTDAQKTGKDKAVHWLDITSKLLIPLVIFLLGQCYTARQQEDNDRRYKLEQSTNNQHYILDQYTKLIGPLSSSNPSERRIASVILGNIAPSDDSIAAHILLAMSGDADSAVAQAAKAAFIRKVTTNPRDAQSAITAAKSDPIQSDLLSKASTEDTALSNALKKADPKWKPLLTIKPKSIIPNKDCVSVPPKHPLLHLIPH